MSKRDTTWISEWNPEDEKFWESKGKFIARRNLIWSIVAEHLGFSIWLLWSIVATKLPQVGFNYTTDQLFQLVALPGLVGSLLRFPYTFAVPRFGGRNWTIVSAALLFIPTIVLACFVARPDTPFWLMLIVAASAGFGGGNFASSMANISFFYPNRMKGWALGLNAAGGNIGVSGVQLLTPILIGSGWVSVVVGNGMAATRFVDELMQRALGRYSVIVIEAEPRLSYNRILLSSLLAGDVAEAAIELKPRGWWNGHGVTTAYGQPIASIDRRSRVVTLADGQNFTFSKLVLATGSLPIRLPKPGMDLQNVLTFRDFADVGAMRALMRQGARAVVIGGGLLGIEAAYGLAKAGVKVTLVHLMDRLMERQLDHRAALLLKRSIEAKGVEVLLGADTKRVLGEDHATGLELSGGRLLPADFVVCAVGVRPNAQLARDAGLAVNSGIMIDDGLTTSDPNIFALGECAEHRGCVYGLVEPATEQARILARRLAGDRNVAYPGSVSATNLKVSSVNVFSAGKFMQSPSSDIITLEDEGVASYKKFVIEDGRLKGTVLFGDMADALWYLDLIRSGADISHLRDALAFGPALAPPQAA